MAEITTDPWPRKGPGELPTPRAEVVCDGLVARLLYGERDDPVLELEALEVCKVLTMSGG